MISTSFAPATVANVAVGFDVLGLALEGLGEIVHVERWEGSRSVEIEAHGPNGRITLPTDPRENTAGAGLLRLISDRNLNFGFRVRINKQIPVGSGLGGSSTSAVGAIVAANAFLRPRLTAAELLHYALTGEAVASGSRHADNVAPCLEGGLVLVRHDSKGDLSTVQLRRPRGLTCSVLLPELSIQTKEARRILAPHVPLSQMIEQSANLAGFVAGCYRNDFELIGRSLRDVVIEPQRAHMIPGFFDLQKTAMDSGALGCSLSGSGPAIFALSANAKVADRVRSAWIAASAKIKMDVKGSWVSPVASRGAHLLTSPRKKTRSAVRRKK